MWVNANCASGLDEEEPVVFCSKCPDFSVLPCRILVWNWVGQASWEERWLCGRSAVLQLPSQIWHICTPISCTEVSTEPLGMFGLPDYFLIHFQCETKFWADTEDTNVFFCKWKFITSTKNRVILEQLFWKQSVKLEMHFPLFLLQLPEVFLFHGLC